MAKFNTKRQTVHLYDTIYYHELQDKTLSEIIDRLMDLQRKHSGDAMFELDIDSGECSSSASVRVSSTHPETDKEYNERLEQYKVLDKAIREQAATRKKQREEYDRKEFARLKKKFDKK